MPVTGAFVVGAITVALPTLPIFCAAYCSVCGSASTRVVNWLVCDFPPAKVAFTVVTYEPGCVVTPNSTP